jgi:hypothetical protein
VQADELRARVPPHDLAARLLQLAIAGEIFAVKRPVGMRVQFFPWFVEAVGGRRSPQGKALFGLAKVD